MSLYRPIIGVNGRSNRVLAEKGIVEYDAGLQRRLAACCF
jgi:hypothetical protein